MALLSYTPYTLRQLTDSEVRENLAALLTLETRMTLDDETEEFFRALTREHQRRCILRCPKVGAA